MIATVHVRFEPKPEHAPRVEAILRGMVPNSRTESGCLLYDFYQGADADGAKLYFLVERYRDDVALQAHRDTAYYKAYRAEILDLLLQAPIVTIMTPIDAS